MHQHRSRRRPNHYEHPTGDLFLSWRLKQGQRPREPHERDVVLEVINRGDGVLGRILGIVVLDEHAHVLISPGTGVATSRIAQTWKSVSSHRLTLAGQRSAPVWQENYWDRTLRSIRARYACLDYIAE